MFGLLKDKLSGFVGKFSKKVEEGIEKELKAHLPKEGKPEPAAGEKLKKPAEAVVEPAAAEEEEKIVERQPKAPKTVAKEGPKGKKAAGKEKTQEMLKQLSRFWPVNNAAGKNKKAEDTRKPAGKKAVKPLPFSGVEKEAEGSELPEEETKAEIRPAAEVAPAGPEEEIEITLREPLPEQTAAPAPKKGRFESLFGRKGKKIPSGASPTPAGVAVSAPKKELFGSLFGEKGGKGKAPVESLLKSLNELKQRRESPKKKEASTESRLKTPTIIASVRQESQELLGKITNTVIDGKDIENLLWEFQLGLLENDVAYDTAQKICGDLKANLVGKAVRRGQVDKTVRDAILCSIKDVLKEGFDLMDRIKESPKPFRIIFVGVNGTGKTTTIAKIAHLCKRNSLEPVLAAADTFRAASIEQLEHHARVLDVKIIKQGYGADSTAVAYDAVEHAKATGKDVVLIDTAGRLHSNANLMDELGKMIRVIKPDLVIFVGDAMTGNDAAEQAKQFAALRVDAAILTKADADAKGGACISISHSIQRPILYLGTGQKYEDLTPFSPEWFIEKVVA